MRIGLYGGSFNPPHRGHMGVAKSAVDALALDRLLLIPAGIAPHKEFPAFSPTPIQRLEMVQIAVDSVGDDRISVWDGEVKKPTPSYTWETVALVREHYPDAELFLLMGTDMLLSFPQWKHPERIAREVTLAVFCRGDREEETALDQAVGKLQDSGVRVVRVENPVVELSSTDLRRMLLLGCGEDDLAPGILPYIRENALYRTGEDFRDLPEDRLEEVVRSLQKPKRIPHVLGCRDTAESLAKRWGEDGSLARRAGLLHDVTKALTFSQNLALCQSYGVDKQAYAGEIPATMHQYTGALAAKRIFGEQDAVVSAIRYHATGCPHMTVLQKIVYLADYIEPNRAFPDVEIPRKLAFSDLDEAMRWALRRTIELQKTRGGEMAPLTQMTLESLL